MSTEQKDLEENALASRLSRGWDKFKQGKLISYRMMALILVAVTAIGLTWYILRERTKQASKLWFQLESVSTLSSLEEFAKEHPNTKAGRVARLHVARTLLGPDGIELLAARDPKEQQKAVENIEKARSMFEELAAEVPNEPAMLAESYLGCAKAEQALIGISQKDKPLEFRGSPDKLLGWLDKLAEVAPNTPWGEDAKKFAAAIRDTKDNTRNELINVQSALAKLPPPPSLDPHPPIISPGNTPPGTPTPGVPGVPGFTPEKPGSTPPTAPLAPTAPSGTPPDPKAPTGPAPTPPAAPGTAPPVPTPPTGTTLPPGSITPSGTPAPPPKGPTPPPPTPPKQ